MRHPPTPLQTSAMDKNKELTLIEQTTNVQPSVWKLNHPNTVTIPIDQTDENTLIELAVLNNDRGVVGVGARVKRRC